MSQVTTVTFFNFSRRNQWWMLTQMGKGFPGYRDVPGIKFLKLMGSGAENGFSIKPDWSTYVLLIVWDAEKHAETFFEGNARFRQIANRAQRSWTVYLKNIKAHGKWSKVQPFDEANTYHSGPIAVLTRATIRKHRLFQFWKQVPSVSREVNSSPGLIYSKGIGEFPVFMQATISFWEDYEQMKEFAYQKSSHVHVIHKTRKLGWYREELFANFIPYRLSGDEGNPLNSLFKSGLINGG